MATGYLAHDIPGGTEADETTAGRRRRVAPGALTARALPVPPVQRCAA
jgi:hypothetical protein